jgi:hypothetical protein
MPLIKEVKLPTTPAQRRIQAAAWVLIYAGLLTVVTGLSYLQMHPGNATAANGNGWSTGSCLVLAGSLATALGAVLIYIRSRMS